MTDVRYWVWFQHALGEGAAIKEILAEFSNPKNLYESNIIEWKMSTSLTSRQINRLTDLKLEVADEIIYNCNQNGYKIITYDDNAYPKRLKNIPNPPSVLYVDGDMPDIDNLVSIGIVGTRKASKYAVKTADIMARGITEAGAVVISGGALGVDSAAHTGAIMEKGKTVAVLGCGLGADYLRANKELRNVIKNNGALVSEYPPFTAASRTTFPMRNRIISGLSLGVLVVEAGIKSGSLITANYALEQGRDVYAIPGSVLSLDFEGTNKLIDDGAIVVTKPSQLVEQYKEKFTYLNVDKIKSVKDLMKVTTDVAANAPKSDDNLSFDNLENGRKERLKNEEKSLSLNGDMKKVYDCLTDNLMSMDDIINASSLDSKKVLGALTKLEIMDIIKSASGRRYRRS